MRRLLDWTRFGPASRDYIDWVEGASPLPSTDKQLPDQKWNELTTGEATSTEVIIYIIIAAVSLLFISFLGFLLCRRRCSSGKLGMANVIALADLQDPERNVELLSSIRRGRDAFPSSSSDPELGEGVFLMVYLSAPYEETLTQLARAASITSSRGAEPPRRHSRAVEEPQVVVKHQEETRDQRVDQAAIHPQNKTQNHSPIQPQDTTQNQALIHPQTQDQAQIHSQDKTRNHSLTQPQDMTQNQAQICPQTQNQTQIHSQDKTWDQTQIQTQEKTQNQATIHPQDMTRNQAPIQPQEQEQTLDQAPIQPQE